MMYTRYQVGRGPKFLWGATAVSLLAFLALVLMFTRSVAAQPAGPTAVTLLDINPAQAFTTPVDIAHAGDGRLFIVEQRGLIQSLARPFSEHTAVPFLDIRDRVSSGGETGLLGLAFHPHYAQNGYFYVNYIYQNPVTQQLYSRISRFQVSADPNAADPDSELILLQLAQPFTNHNGGDLAFGADGLLYAALGDGGSGGDPQNNGQNNATLLGSLLRLDVDGGGLPPDCGGSQAAYTVPADNPLRDGPGGTCDEIWAYGLRNPWRIGFDRATQDLFIGDVGQGLWEEIDYQPAGSGGQNYGWRCYEGTHPYNLAGCESNTAVYTFPIAEYAHTSPNGRCSVTGGFVYRGNWYPALVGAYVYGDFCTGELWSLRQTNGVWQNELLLDSPLRISTFGEDVNGEIYLANITDGHIYLLSDPNAPQYLSVELAAPLTAVSSVPFTYTLTVINTSFLTATNLTITNTLPVGATYIGGGSLVGQTIHWNLPQLPPYSTQQVQWSAAITQTVWNEAYGVAADGGVTAVGQMTAVTLINPRHTYLPLAVYP